MIWCLFVHPFNVLKYTVLIHLGKSTVLER